MAFLNRLALATGKTVIKINQRYASGDWVAKSRQFVTFKRQMYEPLGHSDSPRKTIQNIFYFVSVPCLLLGMIAAYRDHHKRKQAGRPEYINYPYLNVRSRPFPWGDGNHSLFHNPRTQYVPGVGYEQDFK